MIQWGWVDTGWLLVILVIGGLAYYFYTHYSAMLKTTGSQLGADIKTAAQTVEKSNVSTVIPNTSAAVKEVVADVKKDL